MSANNREVMAKVRCSLEDIKKSFDDEKRYTAITSFRSLLQTIFKMSLEKDDLSTEQSSFLTALYTQLCQLNQSVHGQNQDNSTSAQEISNFLTNTED
jgi:hypothetical protein